VSWTKRLNYLLIFIKMEEIQNKWHSQTWLWSRVRKLRDFRLEIAFIESILIDLIQDLEAEENKQADRLLQSKTTR